MPEKRLDQLLARLDAPEITGDAQVVVTSLTYDSRKVAGPGALFAAFEGANFDGHRFIGEAVGRGASVVLAARGRAVEAPEGVTVVHVPDTRRALGAVACEFYGDPSGQMTVTGVTGTKGKTTTTYIIAHILESTGVPAGLIGTIGYRTGRFVRPAPNTTPEAAELQEIFYEMRQSGLDQAVMEVSSHAVALGRTALIDFDVVVFTNIGHDHLDFHRTVEQYAEAKADLFRGLGRFGSRAGKPWPKSAVINADDPYSIKMMKASRAAGAHVTAFSARPGPLRDDCDDLATADDVHMDRDGTSFILRHSASGTRIPVKSRLAGAFNVYNALAALAASYELGVSVEQSTAALASFPGVPGRFQLVDLGQEFTVIVDYAHSPDSLANVLATARQITRGQVICVFGCGGDRDRTKRPLMGGIAAEMADYSIVTSDNPRSEDPASIAREVSAGMGANNGRWAVILDRAEAIREAIGRARSGDLVLIAGKGHEPYQVFADHTIDFDDVQVAEAALKELVPGA